MWLGTPARPGSRVDTAPEPRVPQGRCSRPGAALGPCPGQQRPRVGFVPLCLYTQRYLHYAFIDNNIGNKTGAVPVRKASCVSPCGTGERRAAAGVPVPTGASRAGRPCPPEPVTRCRAAAPPPRCRCRRPARSAPSFPRPRRFRVARGPAPVPPDPDPEAAARPRGGGGGAGKCGAGGGRGRAARAVSPSRAPRDAVTGGGCQPARDAARGTGAPRARLPAAGRERRGAGGAGQASGRQRWVAGPGECGWSGGEPGVPRGSGRHAAGCGLRPGAGHSIPVP